MAADGKTPQPTHRGGGGNIMCTCSIFVCRHKNNDMSTLLGHVYTYIQTNHKSIQTYSYTYTWLHMCDVSPLWGGGWGGTRGGWIIYTYHDILLLYIFCCNGNHLIPSSGWPTPISCSWILPTYSWPPTIGAFSYFISSMSFLAIQL